MSRHLAIFLLTMIVASACGGFARRTGTTPAPDETGSVGEAFATFAPEPTDAAENVSDPSAGSRQTPPPVLLVTLTDQNDLHPGGIPVRLTRSGTQRTVETHADGRVRISGPGVFRIEVVQGCHASVRVTGGGFAEVSAPPEGIKPVDLPVRWQHRFAPAPPVHPGRTGDWPVGEDVSLRFSVIDRCAEERAPGASYSSFRFRTNPVVEVVGTPKLKAGDEGRGSVTVTCLREGEPSVEAVDSENPSDSLDLVREAVGFTEPRCSSS